MSSLDGSWTINVTTPMGPQAGTAELRTDGATLTGHTTNSGETVEIKDGTVDGDSASWKADVTKPFPMTLSFDVTVDGDTLSGTAQAGAFPPAPLTGTRAQG